MRCPLHQAAREFGASPALLKADTGGSFPDAASTSKNDVGKRFTLRGKSVSGWSFSDWDAAVEALRPTVRGTGAVALHAPDNFAGAALLFAALRENRPVALLSHRLPPTELDDACQRLGISQRWSGPATPIPAQRSPSPDGTGITPGIATVLLTSGSSGRPKAVAHTAQAHLANAAGSHDNIPFAPGHVWLRSLSLHHVGGLAMLFRALHGGGAVAFPEHGVPLGRACRQFSATHLSVVATQLQRLLAEGPPPDLAAVLVGGGPIPPELVTAARGVGVPIHTTYGMTEMGSQVATTPPGATPEQLRTAGRPLPGRLVRIDDGGEILVRGAPKMAGYLRDDGTLDPGVDGEGWYHTGDVGTLEDGWLRVTGRKDLMFISGGENIYPEEIERVLMGIDGVLAAVVVAVPDPTWGRRPVAFVLGQFEEAALRAALRDRLAGFQVPDRVFAWPGDAPGWSGKPPRRWFMARAAELV